jgi:hypothetical protein
MGSMQLSRRGREVLEAFCDILLDKVAGGARVADIEKCVMEIKEKLVSTRVSNFSRLFNGILYGPWENTRDIAA